MTNHSARFQVAIVGVTLCCKRTGQSVPTEREQVLWLIVLIITIDHLLIAHILMVNAYPTGLGNSFESTSTHLMLANPFEKKVKSKKTHGGSSISSTLTGGGNPGVDLC